MLRTPTQRAAFLLLICGVGALAFGLYRWHQDHRHYWVFHSYYIPDYPPDYSGYQPGERDGIVRKHSECKWTSDISAVAVSQEDKQWLDHGISAGPVVMIDSFLSVDGACAKREITLLEPKALHYSAIPREDAPNPYWNPRLAFGFWRSQNVLTREAIRSSPGFWLGGASDRQRSGREAYKEKLMEELETSGYRGGTAYAIAEGCVKAERKWCVETHRSTYVRLGAITKADPLMLSGAVLILLGLAGSAFYAPLAWLGSRTIGRLWTWVRRGN